MTPDPATGPVCPACAAPLHDAGPPPSGGTGRLRLEDGPLRCGGCGETLYRMGSTVLLHRGAAPVLTMAMAADRLRNHLRRLAIVRLGRIEGDCYLLPFVRMEGRTPDGDETFTLLSASLGEERLEVVFLPPADLKPFEPPRAGAAGASGTAEAVLRVLMPTLSEAALRARAESRGFTVTRCMEIIHYPLWLMRVEDRGRLEGAWMDGIEGKLIHHRMRLSPPLPSGRRAAAALLLPAVAAAAAGTAAPHQALGWAAAIWAAAVPIFHARLLRGWRG